MQCASRWIAAAIARLSILTVTACASGELVDEIASSDPVQAAEEESRVVVPSSSSPGAGDGEAPRSDAANPGDPEGGSCPATTCNTLVDLGSIAGDLGSESSTQQGVGSRWFKLLVREDSSSSTPIRLRAELTSPAGTNYDVFLYTNLYSTTATECSNVRASSTTTAAVDVAGLELKDYSGIGDEQMVTIEVRHVSGPCDPAAKWSLSLTGNKL